MDTITIHLDAADMRRMLRHAYGPHLAPVGEDFARPLPTDGPEQGTSHLATLRTGQRIVLRTAPSPEVDLLTQETDLLGAEVEALQMIPEHTDVPVPAMHHHDESQELVDVDWFCREHVEGTSLDHAVLDHAARLQVTRDLGRQLRALHTIEGESFGRFQQPLMDSWQDAFSGIFEDVLRDAQRFGADLEVDLDRVHGRFLDHSPALDAVRTPVFCLWRTPKSTIVVDEGWIVGLVRPAKTFWADPLLESAFSICLDADSPASSALLSGYGRGPLEPDEVERRRLYDLYDALVRATEAALRHPQDLGARRQDLTAAMARLDHRR
ncbi:phosphotransferase family protein [Luteococcus japonicus]|uniref:Aminoglycoside phosphotransferase domain-containing protein n=1 Tax=Luteococcus japonicus LSP_Lj1 TaxID=1255658 RepID=A0A1R4ID30_9ACTN|nr:phosphotransferase [Luteococcus japonicus]SJN17718.1 hypothetical protein FM114_01145 [Luteococcus japonicus LSP_Lj1]